VYSSVTAYARATMDANQGPPGGDDPEPPIALPLLVEVPAAGLGLGEAGEQAALERRNAADTIGGRVRVGLTRWFVLMLAGSLAAAAFQHPDASVLLATAAVFALVQSWDLRDRARQGELAGEPALEPGAVGFALRALVPLAVPAVSALGYVALGFYAKALPESREHLGAMRWCWAAAAACLAMTIPALARPITSAVLPRAPWSHTARLAASIALALLLLPVPVRLLIADMMDMLTTTGKPLVDVGALVAQLVGEVALAAAAVGLWVTRDTRAARERLGLTAMKGRHLLVAAVGFGAVIALNSGMEALEHARFPALWAADQEMGKLIAGNLNIAAGILLGVSAGVGEELLVRGALQPRAGLFWASVLFTAGHVQYTWFGMLTILLLGLALGIIRDRANTTTAIVVHALYDMFAALGSR
jgi:membrane protease YdiL (CAAX protease family)